MCADNGRKDSIIDIQKSQINELQANEFDLKQGILRGDKLTANYKYDLNYCNEKYSKTKDKANRRAGIAIGSISVNILLGALLYFVAK